jgi:SAM-dependent methyltransferase
MRVLDLMSSWVSHLPGKTAGLDVTGLGLNQEELERNPVLNNRLVHDLNADPRLPFENASFDAAICTVSVEYLIRPVEVIREVARVLRPGAPFVVTFSDRWFPTKVITLWTELHPFERIGLVIDYFRLAGGFTDLASISIRGRPRPADDAHATQRSHADPVFAVSGVRRDDATA